MPTEEQTYVNSVSDEATESESTKYRMKQLIALLQDKFRDIPEHERTQLVTLLEKYSDAFSVTEGERGETNWTEMHINTADAVPKKQPVRRVPLAVRQEVAKQLAKQLVDVRVLTLLPLFRCCCDHSNTTGSTWQI